MTGNGLPRIGGVVTSRVDTFDEDDDGTRRDIARGERLRLVSREGGRIGVVGEAGCWVYLVPGEFDHDARNG